MTGHAAVFGSQAVIAGLFREQVQKGAFLDSLARDDVLALSNHDYSHVIGRTSAGTLRLHEDGIGLAFEVDLPNSYVGDYVAESVARRETVGCSFGFVVRDEDWSDRGDMPLRTLKRVDLSEITITAIPAYEATDVNLRVGLLSPSAVLARFRMKHALLERIAK